MLAAAAPAAAAGPRALSSANVEWLGSLAAPGGVSATFVGDHMFLSGLLGLEVYDISDPAAPVRVGGLSLPSFQNEDVSTNGEILLISRDALLGLSRLYVVDVRDPANPALLSTLDTSTHALTGSVGHTASCIDDCRYAWLAGRTDGIDVVDLRDPARPRFAAPRVVRLPAAACAGSGRRAPCDSTHDVQVDSAGLAWVAGAGGTAAYDVSDPARPVRRMRTDRRGRSSALGLNRSGYNDFIHHNSLRRGRDVLITEEDFKPGCTDPGSLQTWRIGSDGVLRPLDRFEVERDPARSRYCSAHYFDERAGMVVQGWYEAGARFVDWSKPRRLRQAGYWIPLRGDVVSAYWAPTDPSGQIAYAVDEQRGVHILRFDRSTPPARRRPPRQPRGSGVASRPDLATGIALNTTRARPGRTVTYRVGVQNAGRRPGPASRVLVELGSGLSFRRGGGKRRTLGFGALRRGDLAARRLRVKVARGAPATVEAAVSLLLTDGDPANNFGVAVNPTRRRSISASASRPPRLLCAAGAGRRFSGF